MQQLAKDIAEALMTIDQSGVPFKNFQPGVGPYGEPQLVKSVVPHLSGNHSDRYAGARTCRTPYVLIPGLWALEFKIVRPFGDNGIEAEHWSQNLLHPYEGNVSAIGDSIKLSRYTGAEKKGIIVICYEHNPPRIDLSVLISAFELISRDLLDLPLAEKSSAVITNCIHPVHQKATVFGWSLDS